MRWLSTSGLAIPVALLLTGSAARASDTFPGYVETHWGLKKGSVDCILCHTSDEGGTGTAITNFGLSMQDFGAIKKNKDRLLAALDKDQMLAWDSDGDGISDMEELLAHDQGVVGPGADPNDGPGPTVPRFPGPQHGCEAARGPSAPPGWLALAALACVLGVCRGRRTR